MSADILIPVAIWVGSGIAAYGFTVAHFSKWERWMREYDMRPWGRMSKISILSLAIMTSLLGPMGLLIALSHGAHMAGWSLYPRVKP